MNPPLKTLHKKAQEIYKNEPTGHDFSHIKRCLKTARKIQKREGGDKYVLECAILFHDIHRVVSTKEKFVSAKESLPFVKNVLKEFKFDKDTLQKILYLIENHDDKWSNADHPIELSILQDADTLDATGKIGLRRTLTYCKERGIPLYDGSPLDTPAYVPNINPISTTHYVQRTMLPELQTIRTLTGQKLVAKKGKILEKFVETNLKNWEKRK